MSKEWEMADIHISVDDTIVNTLPPDVKTTLGSVPSLYLQCVKNRKHFTDQHYVGIITALFKLKSYENYAQHSVMQKQLCPSESDDVDIYLRRAAALQATHLSLHNALNEILAVPDIALPRLIRTGQRLGLTPAEQRCLDYCLLYNLGHDFLVDGVAPTSNEKMVRAISEYTGMTLAEAMDFCKETREHSVQNVVECIDDAYSFLTYLNMPKEVRTVLSGGSLTSEEFLKVDKTVIGDVLEEEDGFVGLVTPTGKDAEGSGDDGGESFSVSDGLAGLVSDDVYAQLKQIEAMAAADDSDELDGELREGESGGEARAGGEGGGEGEGEGSAEVSDDGELDALLASASDGAGGGRGGGGGGGDGGAGVGSAGSTSPGASSKTTTPPVSANGLGAYSDDFSYLEDYFELIKLRIRASNLRDTDDDEHDGVNYKNPDATKREVDNKLRVAERRLATRLAATAAAGGWRPRLEVLAEARGLHPFEKDVLATLVGGMISPSLRKTLGLEARWGQNSIAVSLLVQSAFRDLRDQVEARKFFYKKSALVTGGFVTVSETSDGDLLRATLDIDRRMVDYVAGLETEITELVDGSSLYEPTVPMESVVLPAEQKELIVDTVTNFEAFRSQRAALGFDDAVHYGRGVILLFHGPPGTGKTMMANALARDLGKKLLVVTYSHMTPEHFRLVLREAKINDALLFMDECEAMFMSREHSNLVNSILGDIERYDGLIVMATNRPADIDEAMHRRISLAVEFHTPAANLRRRIWETHIPQALTVVDADYAHLAKRYELTGGFIKNAILSALSLAVARDRENVVVTGADLEEGARLQLRYRLKMRRFDRGVTPRHGLGGVLVEDDIAGRLAEIVSFEQARNVLFGQWGFASTMREEQGTVALFYGPPGTGKTLAAESIAFEIGRSLKFISCSALLSPYVGQTGHNIESIFHSAAKSECVLVFDECEGLLGARGNGGDSVDRYANMNVQEFLYHLERYKGIVILTTNIPNAMDEAFFRRFRFCLEFKEPSSRLREKLWKHMIPAAAPLADDVVFEQLASSYKFTGGAIKNAVYKAAARAALREAPDRVITMGDLTKACDEEANALQNESAAYASMYN